MTVEVKLFALDGFFDDYLFYKRLDEAGDIFVPEKDTLVSVDRKLDKAKKEVLKQDSIKIGEASFMLDALIPDRRKRSHVPESVRAMRRIFADVPVVDSGLVARARRAMNLPNTTPYSVAKTDNVVDWLELHDGLRVTLESL
mgnify:CR=1 FL=1